MGTWRLDTTDRKSLHNNISNAFSEQNDLLMPSKALLPSLKIFRLLFLIMCKRGSAAAVFFVLWEHTILRCLSNKNP